MTEDDDDTHFLTLLPIIIYFTASIGGSVAVNVQLDEINQTQNIKHNLDENFFLNIDKAANNKIYDMFLNKTNDSQNSSKCMIYPTNYFNHLSEPIDNTPSINMNLIKVNASSSIKWNLNGTKNVYLTSDRIIDRETDRKFLKRIEENLEKSGINVTIDPEASYPNQVPRSVKNAPAGCAVIIINYNCAGTIKDLIEGVSGPQTNGKSEEGYLYDRAKELTGIIYVNVSPETILTESSYLPRAHDDNFSPRSFKGLKNPAEYLLNNGIALIDSLHPLYPVMSTQRADTASNQILVFLKQ